MQFLYPVFLWGLLAVVVPIIIHLLQLRRPQRLLFTNTNFIREVELTTIQRRRIQELLVLLLRIFGITFLVLVFAQPFIPARRQARGDRAVQVLLDTSPSMQAKGGGQSSLLQVAITQAQALGKGFSAATHFHLVGQIGGVVTQPAYLSKVIEIAQANNRTTWDGTASRQQLLSESQDKVYIFSDFQKGTSSVNVLQSISPDKEVVLVPQIAKATANIYVDSVWLDDAFVRMHTNIALHIRLRNGGTQVDANCPIKVRLGKQQVAAFKVTIEPGQSYTTVVQVQLASDKQMLGEVLSGDIPVTFDNSFFFALRPTPAIRVLEIGTEPVAQQAYSSESLFTYSFAKEQQVNYNDVRKANLVLLRELTEVNTGLQAALVEFVKQGGSIVVIPSGAAAERGSTSQLLRALGVGNVQWEVSPPALQEVAMPSAGNPFFKDVFGAQARQVVMPQVSPVIRLGRAGTDILRLRDGDSYLAEYSTLGMGHTYVFTAPFTKAYGDFTTQGLFIPVLYRLAMQSYHANQRLAYRLNEPVVSLEVATTTEANRQENAAFRLIRDSSTFVPTQRLRGASLQLEIPSEMNQPGFYNLQLRGKTLTTLAFNIDRSESNLITYSAAELQQQIGPNHPNVHILNADDQVNALANYQAEQNGQALWRYCLLVVLGCLLLEGLVLRFGRPKVLAKPVVAA
ncbi:BatA domain-containing protein [Hymenobacter ginkgonis]|uniref:BatA domain-containing protein n=1 Tax=Hymenobacter ginkgonis TaxID=2682976 RepID=UPI001E635231|nr:BatA domain-containing protein [Hymenobacter ginkgonis]